jgi:hypothetical protein
VGTFNVNGKMPSQDLSSWVAGRSEKPDENGELQDDGKSISPSKRLSHLPLGEIGPDSADANGSFHYPLFHQDLPLQKLLLPFQEDPYSRKRSR